MKPAHLPILVLLFCLMLLTACTTGGEDNAPVILVATNAGLDAGYISYKHPTDVFSIRIPRGWIVDDLPDAQGVRVQFSVLEDTQTVVRLSVYVVNTGQPMTRETFLAATETYQPPADVAGYEWTQIGSPTDQADGSRRLVGVRQYPLSGARSINIFMQGNGSYFSALDVDVTEASPETLQTLNTVVNTFRVNPVAQLQIGEIVAASTSFSGDVGFEGYRHWSDDAGGFNITGRIVNLTQNPLEAVRITGYLFDGRGNRLSEKSLILSTDVLAIGGTAPFRLRFEGGQPSTAVRYELHAAARVADTDRNRFYGPENFVVDQSGVFYNDNGNLVISGRLANQGSQVATNVKVVVGVLNEQDEVVAAETVFIDKDQLLPGEVGNYEVVVYDVGGPAVRYELTVMGVKQ
jgi:hypothetical protein